MIDKSVSDQKALRMGLKFFAEAVGEIGFQKPLAAYSEEEALRVVEAAIDGFHESKFSEEVPF